MTDGPVRLEVDAGGERLDRWLARRLDRPRNQVQAWIRAGRVRINGGPAKTSTLLAAGDRVEAEPLARRDDRILPEAGELSILYEDPHLAVLDKPPGLTVHPGAGRATGTLVHRLLARYPEIAEVGGPGRPGIVHRLDRGTSGALVVARTPQAYRRLAADFAARRVAKTYLAVVYGDPGPEGRIEAPIGRHPTRRQQMAVRAGGRPAVSTYRRRGVASGLALVEVHLETGRTHQIRVHLKSLHHPLVGDPTYGEAREREAPSRLQTRLRAFARPALHAWRLSFDHPATGERRTFTAPVPTDLAELWRAASGREIPPPYEEEGG